MREVIPMSDMFCFQCEQTAGGKGCAKAGVCGKPAEVAGKHDALTCKLVGLARAAYGKTPGPEADEPMLLSLFATVTNVNSGTAWQNQQKEFDNLPAPLLFTTNCLMPPKPSYAHRVFTTAAVGFPGLRHIPESASGIKDFTPLIRKSLELGGWNEEHHFTGINDIGYLQARQIKGFGRGSTYDTALFEFRPYGSKRKMSMAFINQIRMDFIGNNEDIPF